MACQPNPPPPCPPKVSQPSPAKVQPCPPKSSPSSSNICPRIPQAKSYPSDPDETKRERCVEIWHPGFDARFPYSNQTNNLRKAGSATASDIINCRRVSDPPLRPAARSTRSQAPTIERRSSDNIVGTFTFVQFVRFSSGIFASPRYDSNSPLRCWQNFVDFYRCQSRLGEDDTRCEYYKKAFTSLCPDFWIEKWEDQRESGTFPATLE